MWRWTAVDVADSCAQRQLWRFVLQHSRRRWCGSGGGAAGDSWCGQRGMELEAVLARTHHHKRSHRARGAAGRMPGAQVMRAPTRAHPFQNRSLNGGEDAHLLGRTIRCWHSARPHRSHLPMSCRRARGSGELFSAATRLFAVACGRFCFKAVRADQSLVCRACLPCRRTGSGWTPTSTRSPTLRWARSVAKLGAASKGGR